MCHTSGRESQSRTYRAQFAAFLILIALFVVLVGSRFQASDGDKLAAVVRLIGNKIGNAMPRGISLSTPVEALRKSCQRALRMRSRPGWPPISDWPAWT